MEIMDIIKESFIFPSNNLEKLGIYIGLSFLMAILFIIGALVCALGESIYIVIGLVLFLAGLIVGLILTGYILDVMKSGIDHEDLAPAFDWKNDAILGIKEVVVQIVYYIIPAILTFIVALIANVPGSFMAIFEEIANTTVYESVNATADSALIASFGYVSDATIQAFISSVVITAVVAALLFIIFSFLSTMAEARLAKTGSLGNALNMIEAAKDITRIGTGKVIAVILLCIVIGIVISGILGFLSQQISFLSILSILVTPYLLFFQYRAYGLLYSEIE